MKKSNYSLLFVVASLSLGFAGASYGFTAVTNVAGVVNNDTFGGLGADIGDSFTVTGGSFATYFPGVGDPTITGGDLNKYLFDMKGTVTAVTGAVVDYLGDYRIFYDTDDSGGFNAGDFSYSSGDLNLTVDFGTGGSVFGANGSLSQTAGPDAGFPSTGFSKTNATFTGTYTQNPQDANGTIQGTIQSVPDGGSSLILLGLAALGTFAAKRKFGV